MNKHGLRIMALGIMAIMCFFGSCKGSTGSTDGSDDSSSDSATLTGISVSGAKSAFVKGDVFTYSGISVKANYSDNTTKTIATRKCTYTIGSTALTNNETKLTDVGTFSVTVAYENASASYDITVSKYSIPTYDDNYASISSWANHSSWNLANTHDPTVIYWPEDGYYYMWATDASYGNAHLNSPSGKHFPGKRSKNLVDWEYVPGPFDSCPTWVNTKLNEIRAKMKTEKGISTEGVLDSIDMTTSENAAIIGYWAPCARVINVDGTTKIRMYYSIVADYMIGSGKPNITANFDNTWSERAFIGVCETTNPNGGPSAWTDLGFVTCSSSDKGTDYSRASTSDWNAYFYFNAIDPTYFIDDDGTHWMIYGSWHSGFALTRINPATGKIAAVDGSDYLTGNVTGDFEMGNPWASSAEGLAENGYGTRIFARGTSRWQPSEGPELIKKDGWYYLFFADDGLSIPYQTRVVRASSIQGPYYAIQGSEMTTNVGTGYSQSSTNIYPIITHPYKFTGALDTNTYGWVGFSHCAIFQTKDGDWMYMSQARLPAGVSGINASNALMMGHVRKIYWVPKNSNSTSDTTDYWPAVSPERYVGSESLVSNELSSTDIVGKWEHIDLGSTYGASGNDSTDAAAALWSTALMGSSTDLYLNSDGTMTGAYIGNWSFNAEKNWITLTSSDFGTRIVQVARELDWEVSPRKETLVYVGFGSNNTTNDSFRKTFWGKKVSSENDTNTINSFGVYLSSDGNTFDVTSFKINGTEQLSETKSYTSTAWISSCSAAENAGCLIADIGGGEENRAVVSFTMQNFGTATYGYQLWNLGFQDKTTSDSSACVIRSDGAYINSPSDYHSSESTGWNDGSATVSGTWATDSTCNTIYNEATPITVTAYIYYSMIKVLVTKSDGSVISTAIWSRSNS